MQTHSKNCVTELGSKNINTSVHYNLYLYRAELQKRNSPFMKLSQVKLQLTDCLIINTLRNLSSFDVAEVVVLNRELEFKKKLSKKMHKIRKLEKLGLKNIDPNLIS